MNTRSVQRTLLASAGFKTLPVGVLTDVQDPGMRIGNEFQASIPEYQAEGNDTTSNNPGSLLLWKPSDLLSDTELDNYLLLAKERYGYGLDQALGMLYYHNHDISKAITDLSNFCPLKEEWSIEDKVVFEQAFRYHTKNFHRIRLMLPDKPISSLVKYYYLWKRSYSRYSLMDKQALKNSKRMSSGLPPSNDDTDSTHSGSNRSLDTSPHILPPVQLVGKGKQLPKGIYMSTAELSVLALDGSDCLNGLDSELSSLKVEVQTGKQDINDLKSRISKSEEFIEHLRPTNVTQKGSLPPTKWSDDEIKIALEVISKQGKDIEALSRSLPSKTSAQCRNFFTNYKRKLNLPRLIAEYEIRNGHKLSRYSRQAGEQLRESYSSESTYTDLHQTTTVLGVHELSTTTDINDRNSQLHQTSSTEDGANKRPRLADYSFCE